MRVLHVISSLDPSTGGPPMVAARLAAAQAARGAHTQIISYGHRTAQANIATALATIPGMAAVDLQYLPPLTRQEHYLPRVAQRTLAPLAADADLLHLHGVWDPLIRTAARAAMRAGKLYVMTPHGMLDPWALSQKRWKKSIALATGYRQIINGCAFIHFLNTDEMNLVAPLRLTAPGKVIPNGIFLEELTPLPPVGAFRAAYPQLAQRPFVLFLGRLHYKKGLDFLADAFALVCAKMPDPLLVVAGPDEGARPAFEAQARRLGIEDRVQLVGPVYGPAKIAALRDCACFCLPSRQEGFSLAILEAMACEAPLALSTQCHFPEAAVAGRIVELHASSLAGALIELLGNPRNAAAMGRAGRALVEAHYTWPRVADATLEAYDQAARERIGSMLAGV